MKLTTFIDCNIIIDLLGKREPHYISAAKLFSLIDNGEIIGYTSPLVISNCYYILRKTLGKKNAFNKIKVLYDMLDITKIDKKITDSAFKKNYKDLEDDIHYFAAIESKIDYIITRNKSDFRSQKIKIFNADEFIKIYTEFIK